MSSGQTTQHAKAAATEGFHHAHEQGEKAESGMKEKMQHMKEDAKETLKKMTHPFNKEKKAGDAAQAEAHKEMATEARQEKNAMHTERGQAARQDAEARYGGNPNSTGASLGQDAEAGRVHGGSTAEKVMDKITPGEGLTGTGPRGEYGNTGTGMGSNYGQQL
ncbi:hypothetical protein KFL_001070270 [Klebsormidium nitens]|uniref:Late embryogenesis abundant protein n=1 Tax=Klebsormidium nitens TaxID=105231 RepID=A0A1Y1HZG3_KLENI|nr:hypothetical protein KFL_001070270 [Klebsormidium nitens]|eukprot:GAQ82321.1 hypothetical protein KFL_001070270 [Klebsormidium nitens]